MDSTCAMPNFFLAVLVRECPAAEAQRPDGAVHHRRSNLEVVAVGDRIIGFVDAGKPGNEK